MLCTPLVHNKGVSCTPQTVNTEAQTGNIYLHDTEESLNIQIQGCTHVLQHLLRIATSFNVSVFFFVMRRQLCTQSRRPASPGAGVRSYADEHVQSVHTKARWPALTGMYELGPFWSLN